MKYLSGVVTLHLNAGACVGCGVCAEVCPRGVLAIAHGTVVINDRDLCIECGACAKNCAYGAIGVKAGVGCAAALINGLIKGGDPECGCCGPAPKAKGCC
jgi:ferredoxin